MFMNMTVFRTEIFKMSWYCTTFFFEKFYKKTVGVCVFIRVVEGAASRRLNKSMEAWWVKPGNVFTMA